MDAQKLKLGTGFEGKDDQKKKKKMSIQIHLPSTKIQSLDRFQKEKQDI